jgi:hypothetical protein
MGRPGKSGLSLRLLRRGLIIKLQILNKQLKTGVQLCDKMILFYISACFAGLFNRREWSGYATNLSFWQGILGVRW